MLCTQWILERTYSLLQTGNRSVPCSCKTANSSTSIIEVNNFLSQNIFFSEALKFPTSTHLASTNKYNFISSSHEILYLQLWKSVLSYVHVTVHHELKLRSWSDQEHQCSMNQCITVLNYDYELGSVIEEGDHNRILLVLYNSGWWLMT